MENEWDHNEELTPLPEHTFYPEYTPEYPDVTFFKESSVTMREENIFQGEHPPGESPRDLREERKKKRSRWAWFRRISMKMHLRFQMIIRRENWPPSGKATRLRRTNTILTILLSSGRRPAKSPALAATSARNVTCG